MIILLQISVDLKDIMYVIIIWTDHQVFVMNGETIFYVIFFVCVCMGIAKVKLLPRQL